MSGKKKKRIIGLFLLCLVLAAGIGYGNSDIFRCRFRILQGNYYNGCGEYEKACAAYARALNLSGYIEPAKIRQKLAENAVVWGDALSAAGDFSGAYGRYVQALNYYPRGELSVMAEKSMARNYFAWGKECAGQGQYEEADRHFRRALEKHIYLSENVVAEIEIALTKNCLIFGTYCAEQGLYDEASRYLSDALDKDKEAFLTEDEKNRAGNTLIQNYVAWGRDCSERKVFWEADRHFRQALDAAGKRGLLTKDGEKEIKDALTENGLAFAERYLVMDQPYEAVEMLDSVISVTGSEKLKEKRMDIISKSVVAEEISSYGIDFYYYDEAGNITENRSFDHSCTLTHIKKYENGKIVLNQYFFKGAKGNQLRSSSEYKYDENGKLVEYVETYYNESGVAEKALVRQFRNEILEKDITLILDPEGNVLEEQTESEADFDENGLCLEERHFLYVDDDDPSGGLRRELCAKVTYRYDKNGNCLEKKYFETVDDGLIEYIRKEFRYDEEGHLIAECFYDGEGRLYRLEETMYEGGRMKKAEELHYDQLSESIYRYVENYDEAGNPVLFLRYYGSGLPGEERDWVLNSCTEWKYNANGDLVYRMYYDGDGNLTSGEEIVYDESGRIMKSISYSDGEKVSLFRFVYDEYGILRKKDRYAFLPKTDPESVQEDNGDEVMDNETGNDRKDEQENGSESEHDLGDEYITKFIGEERFDKFGKSIDSRTYVYHYVPGMKK